MNNNFTVASISDLDKFFQESRHSIDNCWLVISAIMILLMQVGFALFEAGSVREKNVVNVLIKNVIDTVCGALIFYVAGYGLMRNQQGGMIGTGSIGEIGFTSEDYLLWVLNFAFSASSATIVSGALAERTFMDTYLCFQMIMTGFVYPISAGWAWGDGWLQRLGYYDAAGSGCVHIIGGTAGFWGTLIMGPRIGFFGRKVSNINHRSQELDNSTEQEENGIIDTSRKLNQRRAISNFGAVKSKNEINQIKFEDAEKLPMLSRIKVFKREFKELDKLSDIKVEHLIRTYDANLKSKFQYSSMQHIVIGGLILWLSWFFFNGSAGFTITKMAKDPSKIPPKTILNTLLSGSVAALVVFFFKPVIMRKVSPVSNFNPANIINGLLSGHVAITGACNNVEPYSAIAIGLIAGFWYIFSCRLIVRMKVDDPVNASQIHLFCGIWGVLAVGFFDDTKGLIHTGDFKQLGIQCLGILALFAWASLISIPYFYIILKLKRLRVPPVYEIIGLDTIFHEESDKYNIQTKGSLVRLHQSVADGGFGGAYAGFNRR